MTPRLGKSCEGAGHAEACGRIKSSVCSSESVCECLPDFVNLRSQECVCKPGYMVSLDEKSCDSSKSSLISFCIFTAVILFVYIHCISCQPWKTMENLWKCPITWRRHFQPLKVQKMTFWKVFQHWKSPWNRYIFKVFTRDIFWAKRLARCHQIIQSP